MTDLENGKRVGPAFADAINAQDWEVVAAVTNCYNSKTSCTYHGKRSLATRTISLQ
jgi:hypothetical protein